MNCHEYQEAIVDFARHALDEDGQRRLRSHLDGCRACEARVRQQMVLTDRLKALVSGAAGETPSSALETALLERFVFEHAAAGAAAPESTVVRGLSPWIKAAAAVVCATVPLAWWLLAGAKHPQQPARAAVDAPRQPAVSATPPPAPSTVAAAPAATVPKPPQLRPPPRVIHPDGFVPLPSSAGLPSFESGEIVRMEVPVTWLSSYGVQVSPDLGSRPIQADLLVGQDGHPRAIRLVTNENRVRAGAPTRISTEDSRSRQ